MNRVGRELRHEKEAKTGGLKAAKHTNTVFLNMLKKPRSFLTCKQKAAGNVPGLLGTLTLNYLLSMGSGLGDEERFCVLTQNLENCLEIVR